MEEKPTRKCPQMENNTIRYNKIIGKTTYVSTKYETEIHDGTIPGLKDGFNMMEKMMARCLDGNIYFVTKRQKNFETYRNS